MVFGGDRKDRERADGTTEGLLPELVRRAVERSVQAILHTEEGRKNVVAALMPRELISTVMNQIDGTKKDAVAMIGREMQSFLQTLNVGEELRKILTSVSFEIKTEVRFIPNEDGTLSSQVTASARPKVVDDKAKRKAKAGKRKAAAAKAAALGTAQREAKPPRKVKAKARATATETVMAAAQGTRKTMRRVVDRIGERAADLAEAVGGGGEDGGEE